VARFTIGTLPFIISPAGVAKCFVALSAWELHGRLRDREQFNAFCGALMPRVIAYGDEQRLALFCGRVNGEMGRILGRHDMTLPPVRAFRRALRRVLASESYQQRVIAQAEAYERWLAALLASPYGPLAARAVAYLAAWEVLPLRPTYGAVGSFGGLVAGKYVPWLDACAVQMDVACAGPHPELCFLETLLHEQVHAVVAHRMGQDDRRRELEWLHELGAILTSQHALARAAADLGNQALRAEVRAYLALSRRTTAYGDLAEVVLRETQTPEVGWAIWSKIIALRRIPKQDYACRRVLAPLLRASGWEVSLPYRYAGGAVDALECRQEQRWSI
jgi:hypothetical protein